MRNPHLEADALPEGHPEQDQELVLRPRTFEDFTGQTKVMENLRVFVAAALGRGEALDHVLLHGPPGLGKTKGMSYSLMKFIA